MQVADLRLCKYRARVFSSSDKPAIASISAISLTSSTDLALAWRSKQSQRSRLCYTETTQDDTLLLQLPIQCNCALCQHSEISCHSLTAIYDTKLRSKITYIVSGGALNSITHSDTKHMQSAHHHCVSYNFKKLWHQVRRIKGKI